MDFEKIKRLFLQTLIGCLVVAAFLAVVTVLIGKFNDVLARALVTLLLVAIHSLVSFGFIVNREKKKTPEDLEVFTNSIFVIIVLSFITSVFGLWGLISGALVGQLYLTYFVLLFAILHGEVLAQTLNKQASIDNIVYANYVFMSVVVLMILPLIFLGSENSFGAIYYRFLAAAGIIDATLTLLAVILHKLYLQKHPTVKSAVFEIQPGGQQANGQTAQTPAHPKRTINIFVVILIGYLSLQIIGALVVAVLGHIQR